jgi:putative transposase
VYLVIIGTTPEGKKELLGFQVGTRESAQSWRELLVDLKARGLAVAPKVAVGDGALGFWKALNEGFPAAEAAMDTFAEKYGASTTTR